MYDAGTRPDGYLRAYAREFNTVEIDATFYGTPPPGRLARWASQVPDDFTFAVKLPREITHDRRLVSPEAAIDAFLTTVDELGTKLEAILVQLPPDFVTAEIATFEEFVAALPAGPRWAVEFRDAAWFQGDVRLRVRDALGSRGIALAVTDGTYVPVEMMLHELRHPTTSHAYLRWLGRPEAFARFDRVQVDRRADIAHWVEAIKDAAGQLTRLAGYANNLFAGHSPQTIRDVYAALGIAHQRPHLVEQTSLFE